MNDWNLVIRGVGSHHSGSAKDAEVLAKKFVEDLKAAGHDVRVASFTPSPKGDEDLAANEDAG